MIRRGVHGAGPARVRLVLLKKVGAGMERMGVLRLFTAWHGSSFWSWRKSGAPDTAAARAAPVNRFSADSATG
ncbi:hypothetical protein GCM10010221_47570 [Streptomyces parvus]|nr:hypothetical protein GCM10010221_47570 [Streptomyces parvus]